MFLTLIRQELLIHLMSARFFAAVIITLLLVVANTFVLIGAHEERLADYSQRDAVNQEGIATTPTYSVLKRRGCTSTRRKRRGWFLETLRT